MMRVTGISKRFKSYQSPADRLKEIFFRKKYHRDIVALEDISFEVQEGETLGIVGQNGAGKSTILKILSGILLPDTGSIEIGGKVTGLLELGTGFNPELTGIENIYMNGTFLGMPRAEIDEKKSEIMDFAELGEFIYEPIRTYSSGMLMRLAFSVAIHAEPKCFLVDEALSVGDAYFQQKCMRKILEFKNTGGSIIFVSHDMNAVKTLCDSAILLDKGRVLEYGDPKSIVDYYYGMILKKSHMGDTEVELTKIDSIERGGASSTSTGEVRLVSFNILNERNEPISYIESEQTVKFVCELESLKDFSDPHYGLAIRNNLGVSVFETNTYCMGITNSPLKKGQNIKITYEMKIPLSAGNYSISIGVANSGYDRGSFEEYLLLAHDVDILKVISRNDSIIYSGVFNMSPQVSVK
ncbi:ABC transporter [Methanosarcina barkeri str. Wiesmoor]|uniref:ABC transporter n=2 Tax=Methanosarcina barkeri TaxID=2208 RepID=A0A0E3QJH4_METBA|nr:ABC transporter ATP-binding protein [Methanosarcina barkeri]AKB49880.1 ABC transporter [Methanosarcina barkeri str. Wiesmoor]